MKNNLTVAVFVPITISIKLGVVYVNGPRETYYILCGCAMYMEELNVFIYILHLYLMFKCP